MNNNIAFCSISAGSGKTTIIIAIIDLLKKRGINLYPLKPIAITSETELIEEFTVPWSLYAQVKQSNYDYMPIFNHILLKPLDSTEPDVIFDEKLYEVYYKGKKDREILGKYYKEYESKYVDEIMKDLSIHTGWCLETTGDISSDKLKLNLKIAKVFGFRMILVIDVNEPIKEDKIERALDYLYLNNILVNGAILTKYYSETYIEDYRKFLNIRNIQIIGKIPMYSQMIDSSEELFDEWSNFVLDRIDLESIINMITY